MKRLLRKILFFLSYIIHKDDESKVIYYHDVSKKYTEMGTEFSVIKTHFDCIRNQGYSIVPTISKKQREVMICFDDGWAGIYDYKDEFVKLQIFPTIFIAVNLIGKEGYLTDKQIKELETIGFRFMAHSWSHEDLTTFDAKGLEHELKESKEWLEDKFGHSFDAICYPMGRFSEQVIKMSIESGYTQLYTSLPGGYFDMQDDKLICRNCAQDVSKHEIKWILNGTSRLYKVRLRHQHYQE